MTIVTAVAVRACSTRWRSPAIAQVVFPGAADGSLVQADGRVVGSVLIAQEFTQAGYFHPRPSAAGAGYDAMASAASNLGPTSRTLIADVKCPASSNPCAATRACARAPSRWTWSPRRAADSIPDITVANARAQAPRVAAARDMSVAAVLRSSRAHTTGRTFGFLGEPRVNVLELNLALDAAGTSGRR